MAIKSSNQITFTEHKKIIETKEWYLATSENKDITSKTEGWSTDIPTMTSIDKYLWNYEEVVYSLGSSDVSEPVIIGVYGEVGSSLEVKYISSATTPVIVNNDVSAWSDTVPLPVDGERIYMTQKLSTDENWSVPIPISAVDGEAPTMEIVNGYWYVNGESTNVKATGADGDTPEVTIGPNGNWFINGVDTGTKAQGEAGKDGSGIEYVYYLSKTEQTSLGNPSYTNGVLTTGWTESPSGITLEYKYEYVSVRTKPIGGEWSGFSKPVIWSKWGEKGQDGDGIEYRYYLSNSSSTPTYIENDPLWTDEPSGVSENKQYEYVVQIKLSNGVAISSDPALWAKYGATGSSLQIKYINSATVPTIVNNNVSEWSDTVPAPETDKKTYMTQKLSTDTKWSTPIQISGTDGKDGSANIEINNEGYWIINGENTNVKAEGTDGDTPTVEIIDGYWFINGANSNIKAQGEAGKDGADIEFVYYRSENETVLSAPYYTNGVLTSGWTASPQGITETYKYEYVSMRTKPAGGNWENFSIPVIWSKWGEKGQDGDGVEYKYYLQNSDTPPTYSASDTKWTDDPTGVSEIQQYEYVVQIKTSNGATTISYPSLWAKYGEDGIDGKGISSITNYYATTIDASITPTNWDTAVPELTPTDKYLWNYEYILYTDGSNTQTTAAIIGVYGDSGVDAVDFQIYSVSGFEFSDDLHAIELKTIAFQAGENLEESNVTYQWKWWNTESELDDKYEKIAGATLSTLIVSNDDVYALSSIKCEMTYNGIVYEDYVSLTNKIIAYTAVVNFFNGSNVIAVEDDYLIMYVELYKNNDPEELLYSHNVYKSDENSVQDNIINTDIGAEYAEGDMVYFVCKIMSGNAIEYDAVLGKYTSGQWQVVPSIYGYKNNLFTLTTSPVIFVPKEKITKALSINCEVLKDGSVVARTNAIVMDLNDPIIGSSAPDDPQGGQLWLDTSVSPSILKMWDGSKWVNSGYQNGNVVYTSKPNDGYTKGDLWILADGETCGDFGPGSMLKANTTSSSFDESHWEDAMEENTAVLNNVKQYFLFNADTGLRIGQSDDKFYVNISSTEMGFYDASSGSAQKVVSISNQSATIKDITVEDGAMFNCEVRFGNFIWKTESNGSLSLALAT